MPVPIWAGHYIGLPFREHGRDRSGLDCWGLVRLVLGEQFGIALPSLAYTYRRTTDASRISQTVEEHVKSWQSIRPGCEKQGDVIVLRLSGLPLHVGLILGDGSMLHIERGINSAIEKYNATRWQDRVFGIYRYTSHASGLNT